MAKCKRQKVVIKKGRKVIAEFMGRKGSDCGPRKKPSTAHLRMFKDVMKDAAPSCKRGARGNVKAYRKCIGAAVRQAARG
jgi:hypothetical protein